jgi:glucosamine--fructose-6-phosphate aminotransferase (isomerizing)
VLEQGEQIRQTAIRLLDSRGFFCLGRGINYPLALEGALKIKEISNIHAEGCPAGEMKHGPIALVEAQMPVIVIAPRGAAYEQMTREIEDVTARGGIALAIATAGDEEIEDKVDGVISIPASLGWTQPLLVAPALQLLAYHLGALRGCDVDHPRNLSKSVTAE